MTLNQSTLHIIPPNGPYPGMTKLSKDGKTYACVGVGEEVEKALRERAEK